MYCLESSHFVSELLSSYEDYKKGWCMYNHLWNCGNATFRLASTRRRSKVRPSMIAQEGLSVVIQGAQENWACE